MARLAAPKGIIAGDAWSLSDSPPPDQIHHYKDAASGVADVGVPAVTLYALAVILTFACHLTVCLL